MKKYLLAVMCMCLSVLANAQLEKVSLKSASATSEQGGGESASSVIDGNINTIWHSSYGNTTFPVQLTVELSKKGHVDMVRYIPRPSGSNGNWDEVQVEYCTGMLYNWKDAGTYKLNGSGTAYDFELGEAGVTASRIRFTINSGAGGFASAAEIEAYVYDNTKAEAFKQYFTDGLFTELKSEVTSAEGIEDADIKALVNNLLTSPEEYKKFRVAEYEPYRTTASLRKELKTSALYTQYENPTGIYLNAGDECYVVVEGITTENVGLKLKSWVKHEQGSSYGLKNGLNKITALTEGNAFIDYYTDNYETAPNVKVHFINAPVRGYWDQATMTNDDWKKMLAPLADNDSSVIIVRSEHAQLAYPICLWKKYCPENVDSLMSIYQGVQWAERDMMGLERYGRQTKNRQLFYGTTYGFMAAGGEGAFCHISSLRSLMTPDAKLFGYWGVGHEWGHNNQIQGFCWSGCGETTNNIYASWAEILCSAHPYDLRLEDEYTGVNDYSGMRGGRMQTYFEEGLRKGNRWQLQDGPDYHGSGKETVTVMDIDYDGNPLGMVTTQKRNYDHFVKLAPFWQMNLWGILAGRSPYIITKVIESIRQTDNYTDIYNTNGKQMINFMKLACDSAQINLLPFFEKAGMLRTYDVYIEDYGHGWYKISQDMVDALKEHVAKQGYPDFTDEMNYINGHNYKIYRDRLPLEIPARLGEGCTYANGKVRVEHSVVKNAVAFETYNSKDSLLRITMYGLGSNDEHSFTQVLYPSGTTETEEEAGAYIVAVGFDGTRKTVYAEQHLVKGLSTSKYYTFTCMGRGNALSCGSSTSVDKDGTINWQLARGFRPTTAPMDQIWHLEKDGSAYYIVNPQTGMYLPGKTNEAFSTLVPKAEASTWEVMCVNEASDEFTLKAKSIGQYLNAHSATSTGFWGTGAGDANSRWRVEEVKAVDITIPASGYYAACYPMPLEVPEGVSVYVVGEVSEHDYAGTSYSYAVLEDITGDAIPAYMPVLLGGAAGTYTFNFSREDVPNIDVVNELGGTTLKLTGITRSSSLVDVKSTTDAGSTAMMKTMTGMTEIAANRAYMLKNEIGTGTVYLRTREDMSTGIVEVNGNDADAVLYDVNGTRVAKPERGRVYVTSAGKKVMVM